MKFGSSYFPISITVLETDGLDFLLGLDMLRRYRSCIDLERNVLRFQLGDRVVEEVHFLGEADIPHLRGFKEEKADASLSSSESKVEAEDAISSEKVSQLMSLGSFSKAQVKEALLISNGDVELAAAKLLTYNDQK